MFSKLQYISQGDTPEIQLQNIQSALNAGYKWIQLRFKNGTPEQITELAIKIKILCTAQNAIFIINDHPQIADAVGADGVHLGLTDMDITGAKDIVGSGKIIGGTANTLQDILQRVEEGCSYVGLGPLRFTPTKIKLSPILGFAGYQSILTELRKREISIPIYAIGGIGIDDISALMETGIYGIAASGLITHHPDKKLLLQQFNSLLHDTINHSA